MYIWLHLALQGCRDIYTHTRVIVGMLNPFFSATSCSWMDSHVE